jgi:hypothetical protein
VNKIYLSYQISCNVELDSDGGPVTRSCSWLRSLGRIWRNDRLHLIIAIDQHRIHYYSESGSILWRPSTPSANTFLANALPPPAFPGRRTIWFYPSKTCDLMYGPDGREGDSHPQISLTSPSAKVRVEFTIQKVWLCVQNRNQ